MCGLKLIISYLNQPLLLAMQTLLQSLIGNRGALVSLFIVSRWNRYLPRDLPEQYIYTDIKIESPRMKRIKYLCETKKKRT